MTGNKPEKKFRIGTVTATVWLNKAKTAEERDFYTVNLARSYKDKKGEWQETNSLNARDVLNAVLVLQKAYEHIALKETE